MLSVFLVLLMMGGGSPIMPDVNSVLHLIGVEKGAHACPISENLALTAGHVCKGEPAEAPKEYRFETNDGTEGVVRCVWGWNSADLALMESSAKLRFYPIAQTRPEVGEMVFHLGYDWRKVEDVYGDRVWVGPITRVRAGHIYFKNAPDPGSSGTCTFDAAGEVEGIYEGWNSAQEMEINNQGAQVPKRVGSSVGVWGPWKPIMPVKKEE